MSHIETSTLDMIKEENEGNQKIKKRDFLPLIFGKMSINTYRNSSKELK